MDTNNGYQPYIPIVGPGKRSMVKHLAGMCETLTFIPSNMKGEGEGGKERKKKRNRRKEKITGEDIP